LKFVLLTLTTAKETWAQEAKELYTQKLKPFVPFEIKELKPKKSSRDQREFKLKEESELILKELSADDFVILFDERGKSLSSEEFASQFEKIFLSGKKRTVFIIGGAFGVDDSVRRRAQVVVSFSKMVMNHLVAQTVALEQIYRAFTILKKIPYHNS
jgi:23S rRNA (pseudouridine1915-N3)-methyltransferase